ncbi:MAG TPA: pantoate--beta-alanine ligase, partial [Paracoccus sp. (in: a-proteobacteria)]|nr:pantoate--beta-alanine ligase [Paracoccus sp. (in: a-proteobacteria)]
YRAMTAAAQALRQGQPADAVLQDARARIVAGGFDRVEYLDLRHPDTLAPLDHVGGPARLLAAAWLGPVRLIDNIAI